MRIVETAMHGRIINMSVHITIHRGTEQIGGSVTEISMGKTNILVDFGNSLPGSQGTVSDDELVKRVFHR